MKAFEKTRKTALIGILSAFAFILMLIEIPFIPSASFLKYDPSDIVPLIAGLYSGLSPAVFIVVLRNLLHLLLKPGDFPFLGSFMSFTASLSYILPFIIIYSSKKSRLMAFSGFIASTLIMCAVMAFVSFLILPYFFPFLKNRETLFNFLLFASFPFNFLKGCLNGLIVFFTYKKLSPLLRELRNEL